MVLQTPALGWMLQNNWGWGVTGVVGCRGPAITGLHQRSELGNRPQLSTLSWSSAELPKQAHIVMLLFWIDWRQFRGFLACALCLLVCIPAGNSNLVVSTSSYCGGAFKVTRCWSLKITWIWAPLMMVASSVPGDCGDALNTWKLQVRWKVLPLLCP